MGGRTIPQFGVHYEPTELSRFDLSLDLLPLINSRAVGLLDHERMMMQLVSLERTSVRGGRDRMDNPVADAAAGGACPQGQRVQPGAASARQCATCRRIQAFRAVDCLRKEPTIMILSSHLDATLYRARIGSPTQHPGSGARVEGPGTHRFASRLSVMAHDASYYRAQADICHRLALSQPPPLDQHYQQLAERWARMADEQEAIKLHLGRRGSFWSRLKARFARPS
jgi:hypothetical protein